MPAEGAPRFAEHGLISLARKPYPAVAAGRLVVPPPSHVLDHLVRHYLLDEEAALHAPADFELLFHDPGTTAMFIGAELPDCDLCSAAGRGSREARYDGPSSTRPKAPWAYLCPDCFAIHAPPILGLGRAQYLFGREEIPPEVEPAFLRAREVWAAKGVEPLPHNPFVEES